MKIRASKDIRNFTFIEMMLVISVMGILMGIMIPAFFKIKDKARYVEWQGFNATVNMDPDIVINYNFEFDDFSVYNNGSDVDALYNGAAGNKSAGFSQYSYHGLIQGNPEWAYGGGRWGFKNALQFDGHNDCVTLPNSKLLNLNPGTDDFTFTTWVQFNSTGIQYIFSKAKNVKKSQYNLHYNGENIAAGAGGTLSHWKYEVEPQRWYHMALVNEAGQPMKVYINGELVTTSVGKTDIPEEAIYDANFVLGGLGGENNNPRQLFSGTMDEFMAFERALQPSEIKYHYQMGNPYR
jgi:competence protein ComGC